MSREREPLPTRVEDTPDLPSGYRAALRAGLADLGLVLGSDAQSAIDGHVRLLLAWTEAINLTAIRAPAAVALAHVVDSLAAVPWLVARGVDKVLDLGSGGGFPGLPLAAALPSLQVTLLEPIAKKARFLATTVTAARLDDRVAVTNARAEVVAADSTRRGGWPVVTARAVGTTADLIELAFPLLTPGGALVAWKRGALDAELAGARRALDALGGGSIEVVDVPVAGLRDHRLVVVGRSGRVPDGYPRAPAARRRQPW